MGNRRASGGVDEKGDSLGGSGLRQREQAVVG